MLVLINHDKKLLILLLYEFSRSSRNSTKRYKLLEKYVHVRFTRALLSNISHIQLSQICCCTALRTTAYLSGDFSRRWWSSCAKNSPACFLNSKFFAEFKLHFICSNLSFAANPISTLSEFF